MTHKSSLISLQSKLLSVLVSQNKSSIQMSITSFKGILVNKLSTSRLVMIWSGQNLETSSANERKLCTKISSTVRGDKIEL